MPLAELQRSFKDQKQLDSSTNCVVNVCKMVNLLSVTWTGRPIYVNEHFQRCLQTR